MENPGTSTGTGLSGMDKAKQTVGKINRVISTIAQYISRDLAVMGPLALTGGCLILMFCSRKAMYSWAISIFTLALPLLLLLSNAYPT